MQRPRQHEIEDLSRTLLLQRLPSLWIKRWLPEDYGVDCEVELVDQGIVTGRRIWLQVKGTTRLDRCADDLDSPLRQSMSRLLGDETRGHVRFVVDRRLLDYALTCDFPLLLAVADVVGAEVFWLPLRGHVQSFLDVRNPTWRSQKTVTLHIPASNSLSDEAARDHAGLRWFAMEPARLAALAIVAEYVAELRYCRLSGYMVGEGHLEGEEQELLAAIATFCRLVERVRTLEPLFGRWGYFDSMHLLTQALDRGLQAGRELLDEVPSGRISWASTPIKLGSVAMAKDSLMTLLGSIPRDKYVYRGTDARLDPLGGPLHGGSEI